MGSIRYIGSKARLSNWIMEIAGPPARGCRFHDMFAGTGAVSEAAASYGWRVSANDFLLSAAMQTKARLISREEAVFEKIGGYESSLDALNKLQPVEGFFFREYTDSGRNCSNQPRGYFSISNGMKIDAMRQKISSWRREGQIGEAEHALLLSDLMAAANAVANTAGTYGCFLRKTNPGAMAAIHLTPRRLRATKGGHIITNADVFDVSTQTNSLAYLDPPYTKRQYAAYYHILETIAHEDHPAVSGVTGLRSWKEKSSPFCYKAHALMALEKLLKQIKSARILLSYSSDGHVPMGEMTSCLQSMGELTVHESEGFKRYTPNDKSRTSSAKKPLTEFVFELSRR